MRGTATAAPMGVAWHGVSAQNRTVDTPALSNAWNSLSRDLYTYFLQRAFCRLACNYPRALVKPSVLPAEVSFRARGDDDS